MPKRLEVVQETLTPTYGKFIAEPFEKGFGTTIGNSLRRVLISSIEGTAVSSVRIEGALHEFCAIDGVVEDVAQIILNMKRLVLKSHVKGAKKISIDVTKEGAVTGADIIHDETLEVINKDMHIATLSKKMRFQVEMDVARGRGYVPAERNKQDDNPIGVIPIDSVFSPVSKVAYQVEETRVGQMTDYDKLIIEIFTNGAISPEEALLYAANIYQRHLDIFVNYGEIPEEEEEEEEEEDKEFLALINKPITELELSVRSANCLEAASIKTIGDLVRKTESLMLKYKNFGRKSLSEINEILSAMGLTLGMDVEARLRSKNASSKA
jgi:DNA-directed RNA polymerase subunit alpha